mmetsp:Transcript_4722/g.9611  ORF Transcript_4722/g.9611 Transcript_4722/m.9611 type:complete len:490 (-) Transcript_4722:61-1530(-)
MDTKGGSSATSSTEFFLPNYRMGKTLGIGSFGKVKVAEHVLTGHKVAIKILNRRKIKAMDMDEKVRREIKILRLFMHPHIIRLYEVVETPTDIFVVMEYVKSGELFDYIVEKGRLGEAEALRFFQQIVSGVEYAHRNMVVHRDLKPENLLLDSRLNVKIADFGLSNVMRDGHFLKTSCGSPNYAAPEVISGRLYSGPEVDVWSCGVILYALLCGSLPFDDENIPNLFKKIKGAIYTLPSHLSAGARDLIPRMLFVDPLKRITIPEIRQHGWFSLHLPRYLAVPPPDTVTQAQKLDTETLEAVVKTGFDRQMVMDSLRQRLHNKATVAYYLILDNHRRIQSGYLGSEMCDSETPNVGGGAGQHPFAGAGQHPFAGAGPQVQQRFVAERQWALGIPTRRPPAEVMSELFRALQTLQVGWKRTQPYNIKCRYVKPVPPPPGQPGPRGEMVLKFECQLYRIKEERYVLDAQRLEGPLYTFLDLADRLFAELKL